MFGTDHGGNLTQWLTLLQLLQEALQPIIQGATDNNAVTDWVTQATLQPVPSQPRRHYNLE